MENAVKLTGLWKETSKNNETYLSGSLTPSARLLVFQNKNKQKDTDPDYTAYLVPVEKKQQNGAAAPRQQNGL